MKLGIKFGISAVVAGQKKSSVMAEPTLTAQSTQGKFIITPIVSKTLNIANGEYLMFLNNIQGVEAAIQARSEEILTLAAENNIDIDTVEGQEQIMNMASQWFIAKGVPQYDAKGEPVMVSERYSKADKEKYLEAHKAEIVESNHDELVSVFGDLSDEELADKLTIDMVEVPKYHKCSGCKTGTTSSSNGTGLQLNFSDSAVWAALKADIAEPTTKNRIFDVKLDEGTVIDYFDGFKNVNVTVYPIEFAKDAEVVTRNRKSETAAAAE